MSNQVIILLFIGAIPLGGGQVTFTCPIVRALKPVQFVDQGLVKRIRGIAYGMMHSCNFHTYLLFIKEIAM